jgi:uncharacterized protein YggL (DUF469 family)
VKRRLRKKQHVGEFKEFGITFTATHPYNDAVLQVVARKTEMDKLIDDFLDFVEVRGYTCGGGWSPEDHSTLKWRMTIEIRGYRGATPPIDKAVLLDWELYHFFLERFKEFNLVTSIVDLWTWDDKKLPLGNYAVPTPF